MVAKKTTKKTAKKAAKKKAETPVDPAKPKAVRPISLKVAPVLVQRIVTATAETKAVLFEALRPDIVAYLAAHPAA